MTTVQGLIHRYMGGAWALLVFALFGLFWLMFVREEPFESVSYVATNAPRGGVAFIDVKVVRKPGLDCGVWFSRFVVDAAGRDWIVVPHTYRSAQAIQQMNAASPGRLGIPVQIPEKATPGPAALIIPLSYRCNPVQEVRPIEMVLVYKFEVLP